MKCNSYIANFSDSRQIEERKGLSQAGYTLIEIISVLIILSVLAAIVVPRYVALDVGAKIRAIDYGVAEMNGRESLTWANVKLSQSGWLNDATQVWTQIDTNLGDQYLWDVGPSVTGGTLRFEDQASAVNRSGSTAVTPGHWNR